MMIIIVVTLCVRMFHTITAVRSSFFLVVVIV
jgi:hypothetical protein